MKIEHIAVWTLDLEKMKSFYQNFFDLKSNLSSSYKCNTRMT